MNLHDAFWWAVAILGTFALIWLGIRMYFEEKEKHLDRVLKKMNPKETEK